MSAEQSTIEHVARTKWTRERIFRLGFMVGRGARIDDIAADPVVDTSPHMVRTMTNNMGGMFGEVPRGVTIALRGRALSSLDDEARRRGQTTEAFLGMVAGILAADPVLLANVVDDGA